MRKLVLMIITMIVALRFEVILVFTGIQEQVVMEAFKETVVLENMHKAAAYGCYNC